MQDNEKVRIDPERCRKIGMIIQRLKFRPSFYKREFLTFDADKETKLRAYLYSVAICHQTHTLINKRKNLKGWDYLEHVFLDLAKNRSELLKPEYLSDLSVTKLSDQLRPFFSEDKDPEKCTLDRLEERSRFLIEIGKVLKERYGRRVSSILEHSKGFLIDKGRGLYELLEQFSSFSDPEKKKSTFFIKLISDAGLITIKDPENFVPIMDYHMQRVLLRMGCVEISDKKLKNKLLNKEKLDSDTDIRNACIKAIRAISDVSGYEVIRMNDVFWPLGRSCCKEKTLCFDKVCNKNPCTFDLIVDLPSHEKCVFEGVCKGSADEEYRRYWQPIVETHFY